MAQSAAGTVLEEGLDRPVCLIDVYTSRAWDGLRNRRAALWSPQAETLLDSLQANDRLCAVFDLDADLLAELTTRAPAALERIRDAIATGRLEVVCGYSRPLTPALSGESVIRRLLREVIALRESLGVRPESYLLGDNGVFPQLPQVLRGLGFQQVIVAATIGSSNEARELPIRLRGPDGSEITAAFAVYADGAAASGNADPIGWSNERLESFRGESNVPPLLCRVHGVDAADGPAIARAAVAARADVRFVTPREYFETVAQTAVIRDTTSMPADERFGSQRAGRRSAGRWRRSSRC